MDIHIHISTMLLWYGLYALISWFSIGFIFANFIDGYIWYNGYNITRTHVKIAGIITLFGLASIGIFIYAFFTENNLKHNILHNDQNDNRIIIHGRKSPKVLRILMSDISNNNR